MPDAQTEQVARAAATRLALEMPDGFVEAVEAELATPGSNKPSTYELGTLIALGSLLVSAATLAWTVHKDTRAMSAAAQPSSEVVARKVRIQLREQGHPASNQLDRVVDVVVEEVGKADPH